MEREEREKKNNEYLKQEAQKRTPDYIPFKTRKDKEVFEKGMKKIELNHKDFFKDCPDEITNINSFIAIMAYNSKPLLRFVNESLLSDELRLEITNLWNSLPSGDVE